MTHWLLILIVLLTSVSVSDAAPFYNSSETGCDGTDPNTLLCDDFENDQNDSAPGNWYPLNCDVANAAGGIATQSKGWCGNIFAEPITPSGAVDCSGTIGAEGSCAATSGDLTGWFGRNMADHNFPNNLEHQTVYVRYYRKNSVGFSYGGQKVMTWNRCCNTGGIFWAGTGFNVGAGGSSTAPPTIAIVDVLGANLIWEQNLGNDITLTSGNWYYIEQQVTLNTPGQSNGIWRLWADNCGAAVTNCTGSPTLRAEHTNINWGKTSSNGGIGTIWLENWANPQSSGTEWYDAFRVATVGPIGFTGATPVTPPTAPTNLKGCVGVGCTPALAPSPPTGLIFALLTWLWKRLS